MMESLFLTRIRDRLEKNNELIEPALNAYNPKAWEITDPRESWTDLSFDDILSEMLKRTESMLLQP